MPREDSCVEIQSSLPGSAGRDRVVATEQRRKMVILGTGRFTYEVSGEDWRNLPEGWSYKEATAVAVDSHDNVHVFNRGLALRIRTIDGQMTAPSKR